MKLGDRRRLRPPSHAARVVEMGFDAVLLNTAVARANDPVRMASAFAKAVAAGASPTKPAPWLKAKAPNPRHRWWVRRSGNRRRIEDWVTVLCRS